MLNFEQPCSHCWVTLNQRDRLRELDTTVEVRPVWEWLLAGQSPAGV